MVLGFYQAPRSREKCFYEAPIERIAARGLKSVLVHTSGASVRRSFGRLWRDLLAGDHCLRVGEASLHIRPGEVRMDGQKLIDIRIVSELLEHEAHGNTRSLHHRLSPQNLGIGGDAVFVLRSSSFFHGKAII